MAMGDGFVSAMIEIERKCRNRQLRLVVRDWAHLDFMGVPFVSPPPFRSVLVDELSGSFDLARIALVRHPVDQWLSTVRLELLQGKLDLSSFLLGYRRYAEWCRPIGFVRYEDFTRDPVRILQTICAALQLEFDSAFIDRWADYRKVTGDRNSRGAARPEIRPMPRQALDAQLLAAFRASHDYRVALDLLGYTDPEDGADSHPLDPRQAS